MRQTAARVACLLRRSIGKANPYDRCAYALFAVLVALVLATYESYGISNDEWVQQLYGELLVGFYASGLKDMSAFAFRNLYLYGGLFDIVAVELAWFLQTDPYHTRHVLSAIVGVFGVVGVWLLARLLAGPRAALITALLLALTASWYGAMFNHTKDIPFAVAMLWLLYYSCRLVLSLPRPGWTVVLGIGISAGFALGLRVGAAIGFVYLLPAVAAWAWWYAREHGIMAAGRETAGLAARLLPAFVLAYGIMAFSWPWSVFEPLNPLHALISFSHFKYEIDTLFDGQTIKMYEVPSYYALVYLIVRLPILVLMGLVTAFVLAGIYVARRTQRRLPCERELAVLVVGMAALFPILYSLLTKPYLYSGMRHFFFCVPPIAVLAGMAFDDLLERAAAYGRKAAAALAATLAVSGAVLAAEMAVLHPHQYIFYNSLVGGLPGAVGRWDTDYWVNIIPESVDALETTLLSEFRDEDWSGDPYTVAVCGERASLEPHLPPYLVFTQEWREADFFISPTHMGCDRELVGREIFAVTRLGVKLGVVKDRRDLPVRRIHAGKHPSQQSGDLLTR